MKTMWDTTSISLKIALSVTMIILFSTLIAHAQEAWYEASESCAVNYDTSQNTKETKTLAIDADVMFLMDKVPDSNSAPFQTSIISSLASLGSREGKGGNNL